MGTEIPGDVAERANIPNAIPAPPERSLINSDGRRREPF